jgi:hypothetical protein
MAKIYPILHISGVHSLGKVFAYLLCFIKSMDFIQEQNSFSGTVRQRVRLGKSHTAHLPDMDNEPFASSKTARTSLMPTSVALNSLKIAPASLATSRARVVLPHLQVN